MASVGIMLCVLLTPLQGAAEGMSLQLVAEARSDSNRPMPGVAQLPSATAKSSARRRSPDTESSACGVNMDFTGYSRPSERKAAATRHKSPSASPCASDTKDAAPSATRTTRWTADTDSGYSSQEKGLLATTNSQPATTNSPLLDANASEDICRCAVCLICLCSVFDLCDRCASR
jgi:hypothetical protein